MRYAVSVRPSVRPSVCLSDTFVYCIQTRKRILKLFSPSGSPIISTFNAKYHGKNSDGSDGTTSCSKYSRCRMLLQGWSEEPNVANASHRYCVSFVGCRSDGELNSRLPAWYTKCCEAKYPPIWLTIFISPQKVLLAPSGLLRRESALSLLTAVHTSQSFWRQMLCCSWTTYLEQLTCQSAIETRKSAAQNLEDNW